LLLPPHELFSVPLSMDTFNTQRYFVSKNHMSMESCFPVRFVETPTCPSTFSLKTLSCFECVKTTSKSSCKRLKCKFLSNFLFRRRPSPYRNLGGIRTSTESLVNPLTAARQILFTSQDVIILLGHITCLQTLTKLRVFSPQANYTYRANAACHRS
jgi:hypothetical protein